MKKKTKKEIVKEENQSKNLALVPFKEKKKYRLLKWIKKNKKSKEINHEKKEK